MAIDSGSVGNPVGAGVRVAYALAILTDSRPKASKVAIFSSSTTLKT
jgi:hypothetical protein